MSCELTPDLKRSPAYNAHAASKRPNTKLLFERASFADRSRKCIKHLHKADLKNTCSHCDVNTVFIKSHKNGKESSSECVVASCFKSL